MCETTITLIFAVFSSSLLLLLRMNFSLRIALGDGGARTVLASSSSTTTTNATMPQQTAPMNVKAFAHAAGAATTATTATTTTTTTAAHAKKSVKFADDAINVRVAVDVDDARAHYNDSNNDSGGGGKSGAHVVLRPTVDGDQFSVTVGTDEPAVRFRIVDAKKGQKRQRHQRNSDDADEDDDGMRMPLSRTKLK